MKAVYRFLPTILAISVLLSVAARPPRAQPSAAPPIPSQDHERHDEPTPSQRCAIDSEEVHEPPSRAELTGAMMQYLGCADLLFPALDRLFRDESRDVEWAGRAEQKIAKAAESVQGLSARGECHTSLCRYNFEFSNPESRVTLMNQFQHQLISIEEPGSLAGRVGLSTRTNGFRTYFYRDPPAAFFAPLRKMMEGTRLQTAPN